MNIVLDPGHGGRDPGAQARRLTTLSVVNEKDLNLDVARRVYQALRKRHHTYARLTRHTDRTLSLAARAQYSNRHEADLFVSIHMNAAASDQARGVEVFHLEGAERARECATLVQSRLVNVTGFKDRGVKTANFTVLRRTICPAILVEYGFMSSAADLLHLVDIGFQTKVAEATADAIADFFKLSE